MTVDPGPTAIGSGHSSMAEDAVHEPTMKFHQRLTQSLSLRTSNQASSLQRGTSFTLPDKLRRPSFHLLRRPSQATSSAGSAAAAAAAAAAATSSLEQPLSPRSGRPPLHLDKELPVPPPRSAARRAEKVEEEEQDDDDDDEIEDEDDVEDDDDDDVVPRPASSASSTSTPSTPSSEPQNRFETVDEWLEAYFGDHTKNTQPRNVHAAKDTLTQLLSAMDDHTHPSSSLLLSLKDHVNRVDVHTGEKDPLQVNIR
ncbi:hypothetical protein BC940DRAFT_38515 [Gongronella butleri]|nr:hypothetical protein BC940DRAFT_38515 [Gongronella butleri]